MRLHDPRKLMQPLQRSLLSPLGPRILDNSDCCKPSIHSLPRSPDLGLFSMLIPRASGTVTFTLLRLESINTNTTLRGLPSCGKTANLAQQLKEILVAEG